MTFTHENLTASFGVYDLGEIIFDSIVDENGNEVMEDLTNSQLDRLADAAYKYAKKVRKEAKENSHDYEDYF